MPVDAWFENSMRLGKLSNRASTDATSDVVPPECDGLVVSTEFPVTSLKEKSMTVPFEVLKAVVMQKCREYFGVE